LLLLLLLLPMLLLLVKVKKILLLSSLHLSSLGRRQWLARLDSEPHGCMGLCLGLGQHLDMTLGLGLS